MPLTIDQLQTGHREEADLDKIWSWNPPVAPPQNASLVSLLEAQFRDQPGADCLASTSGRQMSYGELDQLSTKLACYLIKSGLGTRSTGDQQILVPVCFEKSTWAVVAILSILRAGATFVPIDPNQPKARRDAVLDQVNARIVLCSKECEELVASTQTRTIVVEEALFDTLPHFTEEDGVVLPLLNPYDTCYVLFTSGTTGTSKGVVVDHASASSSCLALGANLGMERGRRVFQFGAYTFDACIFEIFGTLIFGGVVCIPSEHERLNELPQVINKLEVDLFAPLTPTVARTISPSEVPSLVTLGLGGEAVSQADIDRWVDVPTLLNVYGPTETVIICCSHVIRPGEAEGLVIGKGIASNTWIVDPYDHNILSSLGEPGELLIEGILATGYLNQPDLTSAAFIDDPPWLLSGCSSQKGRKGRLYKTGDLVRYHPDGSGNVVFVGRKDNQVKISGNRVELGDVEEHVRECFSVGTVVAEVVRVNDKPDRDGPRELLAAFIGDVGCLGSDSLHVPKLEYDGKGLEKLDVPQRLLSALRERVPRNMVPSLYFSIREFPMTSSGKLDRKLLRQLGSEHAIKSASIPWCPTSLPLKDGRGRKEYTDTLQATKETESLDRIWALHAQPVQEPGAATCLHRIFQEQARKHPDSQAVCGWDGTFTYEDLDTMSTVLASHLIRLGVGPGTVVPLIFSTSSWVVVSMLAVLKAGGAFAGIDQRQNAERKNEIIRRIQARVILVSRQDPSNFLDNEGGHMICCDVVVVSQELLSTLAYDDAMSEIPKISAEVSSNFACYLIFTSGTTGTPKGVIIEHGAISTSVLAHAKRMGLRPTSRMLQFSLCSFDASVMEIFLPLSSGGVVCIPSPSERLDSIETAIARLRANFFIITPSVGRVIKAGLGWDSSFSHDSVTVALVGEAPAAADWTGWHDSVRLLNGYGPSECSGGCLMQDIERDKTGLAPSAAATRTIGRPVACVAWVVDAQDHSKLAPFGTDGELLIEGPTLARGYLDNDQTSKSFITDPLWLLEGTPKYPGRQGRLYKTGDIVRYNPDGTIFYVGRRDTEVKFHGQRLDLGEIEHHVQASIPDACAVVVELVTLLNDAPQGQPVDALAAFVATGTEGRHVGDVETSNAPNVRPLQVSAATMSQLAKRLPGIMIPSIFLHLSSIPLTQTGKTDRSTLRKLASSLPRDHLYGLPSSRRQPSTELERRLQKLWAQALSLDPARIGVDDDFYRLGGDSLMAMSVSSLALRADLVISSRDIQERRTIARLAPVTAFRYTAVETSLSLKDIPPTPFVLSPIQKLYFEVNDQRDTRFDQNHFFEIKQPSPVTYESLNGALRAVVSLHSMLRVRLHRERRAWRQTISDDADASYHLEVVQTTDNVSTEAVIASARNAVNISEGPILSAVLFNHSPKKLFVSISHLAVDAVSWGIIMEDIEEFLLTGKIGGVPQISFPSWCKHQEAYFTTNTIGESMPTQNPSGNAVAALQRPSLSYWGINNPDDVLGQTWITRSFALDEKHTSKLLGPCNEAYETQPAMLIVAALVFSFGQVFRDRELPTIYQEGHGREPWGKQLDPSRTVGWFTCLYPIPLGTPTGGISSVDSFLDAVRRSKDAMAGLPRRGWLEFTSRMLKKPKSDFFQDQWPLEIIFNFRGNPHFGRTFSAIEMPDAIDVLNTTRLCSLIEVDPVIIEGQLHVNVHHNAKMKRSDEIAQWTQLFKTSIQEMVALLDCREKSWTLSDFPQTFTNYSQLAEFRDETLPKLGILPAEVEDVFPLTPLQNGIRIGRLKNPSAYMISTTFEFSTGLGATYMIDVDRLRRAWKAVVQRHALLRAVLVDNIPRLSGPGLVVLKRPQADVEMRAQANSQNPSGSQDDNKYNLLYNLTISERDTGVATCTLNINHIIFDAHSKSLLLRDLQAAYAGAMDPVAPSFRLFASQVAHDEPENHYAYWKSYLEGLEPCLIPTGSIAADQNAMNAREVVILSEPAPDVAWDTIRDFCRCHEMTPATLVELAWAWVLRSYTGLTSVCFSHLVSLRGVPVYDQDAHEIFGPLFANLPCRVDFDPSSLICETAETLHRATLNGQAHSNVSLAAIHDLLGLGTGKLSNTCVAMDMAVPTPGKSQFSPVVSTDGNGSTIVRELDAHDPTEFDILIGVEVTYGTMKMFVNYQKGLVAVEDARRIGIALHDALVWILKNPATTWDRMSLITGSDEELIRSWNSSMPGVDNTYLHKQFEDQVRLGPEKQAVCAWDGDLTYGELDNAASLLARHLRRSGLVSVPAGLGDEKLVPLVFEKSKWAMVAMLGILKAGGAFVPVATDPPSRMDKVLIQMPRAIVLTSKGHSKLVRERADNIVVVCQDLLDQLAARAVAAASQSPSNLAPLFPPRPDAVAYVIFTSGTTGQPKGVMIEHAAISTAIRAQGSAFGYGPTTRSYQFTAYTFDASIMEIFATLGNGGCLCIPSEADRTDLSAQPIARMRANTCFFTPTLARLFKPSQLPSVTSLILGGEAVDANILSMWSHVRRVFGLYGPSECSICCAAYEIHRGEPANVVGAVGCPIGRPLGSVSWIVDRNDHNKLAPIGAFGELVIDGPIVGRGYLNDLEKTNQVFITNPSWHEGGPRDPLRSQGVLYKTGDLVRYLNDGSLLFQGRKDSQVKINGQRIELAEVEFHVRAMMPEAAWVIAEVVRLACGEGDEGSGVNKLVVFTGGELVDGGNGINGDDSLLMKPFPVSGQTFLELEKRLPVFMVPSLFCKVYTEKMPTSSSGKTDRKRLRDLASSSFSTSTVAEVQRLANRSTKRQPRNDTERRLQVVWARVLEQDADMIGLDDTFFRLGGTSLSAMKVVRAAGKEGLGISFANILRGMTLGELCSKCKVKQSDDVDIPPYSLLDASRTEIQCLREETAAKIGTTTDQIEDCFPCTPLQEGLISLTAQIPGAYVVQHVLELADHLDLDRFRQAWERATAVAPILRTRILHSRSMGTVQVVLRESFEWTHWHGSLSDFFRGGHGNPATMSLGTNLTQYGVVHDKDSTWLVWTIHHALYDGHSLLMMLELVASAYRNASIPRIKPHKAFVKQIKRIDSLSISSWWASYMSGLKAIHLPPIRPDAGSRNRTRVTYGFLERTVVAALPSSLDIASSTFVRVAWALTVSARTGSDDVVFGMLVSGRQNEPGVERVVGPTMAAVPIRITVRHDETLEKLLQRTQSEAADMTAVEQVGIQKLAKINADTRHASRFQTLLAVQPGSEFFAQNEETNGLWKWKTRPADRGLHEYGLTLQAVVPAHNRGKFVMQAHYDREAISDDEMVQLLDNFVHILEKLPPQGSLSVGQLLQEINSDTDVLHDISSPDSSGKSSYFSNVDNQHSVDGASTTPSSPDTGVQSLPSPRTETDDWKKSHREERRPSTLTERLLQQLWAEVLNIDPSLIGVDDSFVRLGGDSVLAMQLSSLARDYKISVTPRDLLFKKLTIASLAEINTVNSDHATKEVAGIDVAGSASTTDGSSDLSSQTSGVKQLPLAFKTQADLVEFEKNILPKLGVSPAQVEDVIALSALQQGILLSQIARPEAYWNSIVFDIVATQTEGLSVERLRLAWDLVVKRHALLRSMLVEALPGGSKPGFVVLRTCTAGITHHSRPYDSVKAAKLNVGWFRKDSPARSASGSSTGLQHHLSICEIHDTNKFGRSLFKLVCCLHFNHIIMDGHSQSVIFKDLRAAYTGRLNPSPAPSFGSFMAWSLGQSDAHKLAHVYWGNYLRDATPCLLISNSRRDGSNPVGAAVEDTPERNGTLNIIDVLRLPAEVVDRYRRISDSTTAALIQAAWALALRCYTGQSKVCFAYGATGRGAPVPGIDQIIGPIINLLLCQVSLSYEEMKSMTPGKLLDVIGSDNSESLAHLDGFSMTMTLNTLGYDGIRNRLFNTAINVHTPGKLARASRDDYSIDIHPTDELDLTEFDATFSAFEAEDGLAVRMAYRCGSLSVDFAKDVAQTTSQAVLWIINNINEPLCHADFLSVPGPAASYISQLKEVEDMNVTKAAPNRARRTSVTAEPGEESCEDQLRGDDDISAEGKMRRLWSRVLSLPESQVGLQDDFFRLGGDSVAAIQISSRARAIGMDITVRDVMTRRTIKAILSFFSEHSHSPSASGTSSDSQAVARPTTAFGLHTDRPMETNVAFPPSPIQNVYLCMHQDQGSEACAAGFDQYLLLRLKRAFSHSEVSDAIRSLVQLHPMLRVRFSQDEKQHWKQIITADVEGSYRVRRVLLPEIQNEAALALQGSITEARDSLDACTGPLLSSVLFEGGGNPQRLFIAINHLVVDLMSWRVLLRDLEELLTSRVVTMRPIMTYQAWCQWLAPKPQIAVHSSQDECELLDSLHPQRMSYWGVSREQNTAANMLSYEIALDAGLTGRILSQSGCDGGLGSYFQRLLVASLTYSFHRIFNDRDGPDIWNECLGRETDADLHKLDVSGTVGWFTILHPIKYKGHRDHDMIETAQRVRDTISKTPAGGWQAWFAAQHASPQAVRQWPVELIFNYLGLFQQLERPGSLFTMEPTTHVTSSRDEDVRQFAIFDVTAGVMAGTANITFRYNKHVKDQERVTAWISAFEITISTMQSALEAQNTTPKWTVDTFPSIFDNQRDVDDFQSQTLPRMEIPPTAVEDIVPFSPLQQGIYMSQMRDSDSYRTAIILEISAGTDSTGGSVDVDRLLRGWQAVVNKHALLRAVVVDSLPGASLPGFIVLRNATARTQRLEAFGPAADDEHRGYSNPAWWRKHYDPVDMQKVGLQHHMAVVEEEKTTKVFCCLEFNHLIVDAMSTLVLLRDWERAYAGTLDATTVPSRSFLSPDRATGAINLESQRQYWCDQLRGVKPSLFPTSPNTGSGSVTMGPDISDDGHSKRHTRSVSTCSLPSIRSFCRKNTASVANVLQLAWAVTIRAYTGQSSTVVFGHAVSGDRSETEGVVGPLMTMLACRVHFYGSSDTVRLALGRIRDNAAQDLLNQEVSLADILSGLKLRKLYNTALTVRAPVVDVSDSVKNYGKEQSDALMIRQVGGCDPSEFDITVNALDNGSTLDVHVIYRDSDSSRGAHQGSRVARTLWNVLARIVNGNPDNQSVHSIMDVIADQDLDQVWLWNADTPGHWVVDTGSSHRLAPIGAIGELVREIDAGNSEEDTDSVIESPDWLLRGSPHQGIPGRRNRLFKTSQLVRYAPDDPLGSLIHIWHEKKAEQKRHMHDASGAFPVATTDLERRLQHLWAGALGVDPDHISLQDDFFALGGDSAAAMHVVANANRTGVATTVKQIMSCRNLGDLARQASFSTSQPHTDYIPFSLVETRRREEILSEWCSAHGHSRFTDILPATDMQAYCIEMATRAPATALNYMYFDVPAEAGLDTERLGASCKAAVHHFSLLRTVFIRHGGRVWQAVLPSSAKNIPRLHTHEVSPGDTFDQACASMCEADTKTSTFHLGSPPAGFILLKKRGHATSFSMYRFILRLSHAQYDGVSLTLILRAIADAYYGKPLPLTVNFGEFLSRVLAKNKDAEAFWLRKLRGARITEILPLLRQKRQQTLSLAFPASSGVRETVHRVIETPVPPRVEFTASNIIASAWSVVLSYLGKRRDIVFGRVVAGRNTRLRGILDVAGPTFTIVPFRMRLTDAWSAVELLRQSHQQHLGVGEHDAPIGLWDEVRRLKKVGAVGADSCGESSLLPFESVLLHQSMEEENQLVCPFDGGKSSPARPFAMGRTVAPYLRIKSRLGRHDEGAGGRVLDLELEANDSLLDAVTAVWLLELLADVVQDMSADPEMTVAVIQQRLAAKHPL